MWLGREKVSQKPEALGGSASLSDVEEPGWIDDETLKAAHNPNFVSLEGCLA